MVSRCYDSASIILSSSTSRRYNHTTPFFEPGAACIRPALPRTRCENRRAGAKEERRRRGGRGRGVASAGGALGRPRRPAATIIRFARRSFRLRPRDECVRQGRISIRSCKKGVPHILSHGSCAVYGGPNADKPVSPAQTARLPAAVVRAATAYQWAPIIGTTPRSAGSAIRGSDWRGNRRGLDAR